jgi:protoporphyrinogen IX oxidase
VTTFLKFVHLATIAIWSGGLIVLPFLFWQRRGLAGPDLDRLHRMTRFVYVALTSPAAFIAIGSGTALIFLQATFREWFTLKMLLVGVMVMLHVLAGLAAMRRRPIRLAFLRRADRHLSGADRRDYLGRAGQARHQL